MKLIGVDGCQAGWVVAECEIADPATGLLAKPRFSIVPTFRALLDSLRGERTLIAVDIPIGLASGVPQDQGRRRVDEAARRFLGPRRAMSVFSAPCRPTLAAGSYREACELEARSRRHGIGLSQQSYRIIPKIRDVDEAIEPQHQDVPGQGTGTWVREAHPEVTFAVLVGGGQPGHGLVHAKRRCRACRSSDCPGESARLTLLRPYVPGFEPAAAQARLLHEHPRQPGQRGPVVGRDDLVDAVACLVTALRIVQGTALTFPDDGPEMDARGLRMEIVA